MQLIFHGGAREVGRSCIELRTQGDRYLIDCGLKFHTGGFDYPAKVFDSRTLDAVFLSHGHLDHSGALPFFSHYLMSCPIFATAETQEIVKVLLKDSHRIARIKHLCESYDKIDLRTAIKDMRTVVIGQERSFRTIKYSLFNAGHVPGSASVRIKAEGKTVLYTGDYNTVETALMKAADPREWGQVDVLITEATYGVREHPDREAVRAEFVRKVREVIKRGGRVLVPVFAVGRAQEVLLMLARERWDAPIHMDGMARKITRIVASSESPYVRDKQLLRKIFSKINTVDSPGEREAVMRGPGIFITTSGMLEGGPSVAYMDHLYDDPKSAVLLSGYQVPHSGGWRLRNEGTWHVDGERKQVRCEVGSFEFSAHLSGPDIQETIQAVRPRILVLNHGDPEAIEGLGAWAREHAGCEVFAPGVGDQIEIDSTVSQMRAYDEDDGYAFPQEHQHGETCVSASHGQGPSVEDDD